MTTQVWKKAIINTLAASGQNIGIAPATGGFPAQCYISSTDCSSGSAAYTIDATVNEILPPIPYGSVKSIAKQLSAAEQTQILIFGLDTEVIVASQRYSIKIGNMFERYEGETKKVPSTYSYTAPAVLSGTAQTDRDNVYTVLAAKINATSANQVTAYVLYKVAYTAGESTGNLRTYPVIGTTATSAAASQTVKIAGLTITSGTFHGDNAAGTMYVYAPTGTLTAASQVWTCTETDCLFTTAAIPVIQGLVIVDDAGYYPYNPSMRRGPAWIGQDGWSYAHVTEVTTGASAVYGRAGVISQGIGSRLFQDIPYFNADKTDYSQGSPAFILNENPVTTKTYTRLDITVAPGQVEKVLEGNLAPSQFIYTLWIEEDSGLTNHATFLTALAAATGVTPA